MDHLEKLDVYKTKPTCQISCEYVKRFLSYHPDKHTLLKTYSPYSANFPMANAFHAKSQDGCQKRQENNFWQKNDKMTACTLLKSFHLAPVSDVFLSKKCQTTQQTNNLVENALSHTISEINTLFFTEFKTALSYVTDDSRWPPKMAGKHYFGKKWKMNLHIPCGLKNLSKSLYIASFPR